MFGSRVSESKHRKQQPSASTSGGLLEVETIAADGDARGGGSLASSPHVSGANGALLRSTSTSKDRRDHAVLAAFFLAILAANPVIGRLARGRQFVVCRYIIKYINQ